MYFLTEKYPFDTPTFKNEKVKEKFEKAFEDLNKHVANLKRFFGDKKVIYANELIEYDVDQLFLKDNPEYEATDEEPTHSEVPKKNGSATNCDQDELTEKRLAVNNSENNEAEVTVEVEPGEIDGSCAPTAKRLTVTSEYQALLDASVKRYDKSQTKTLAKDKSWQPEVSIEEMDILKIIQEQPEDLLDMGINIGELLIEHGLIDGD